MTEKRFFKMDYDYDWWFIFDREQEFTKKDNLPFPDCENLVPMDEEQVIKLLNENEQLKSKNDYLKSLKWNLDCIKEISIEMQQKQSLEMRNNELVKENEQLKQQLKDCTAKAKEEIRKEKEEMAIRWANIGR